MDWSSKRPEIFQISNFGKPKNGADTPKRLWLGKNPKSSKCFRKREINFGVETYCRFPISVKTTKKNTERKKKGREED